MFFQKPYVNLDFLTSKKKIEELNDYLINEKQIYLYKTKDFIAKGQKHADKISLTSCSKCKDIKEHYNKRIVRGNSKFHIPNENYQKFPKLITFIKDLNIFEDIGNIAIIISPPNVNGIEHQDHHYKWVSEFIWIRTNNIKQFYIKKYGIPHYVKNNLIWFDDQRTHNVYPSSKKSFSIRVNGKYTKKFRKWLANQNNFYKSSNKQILLDNAVSQV
jgi:hypothetical protein